MPLYILYFNNNSKQTYVKVPMCMVFVQILTLETPSGGDIKKETLLCSGLYKQPFH